MGLQTLREADAISMGIARLWCVAALHQFRTERGIGELECRSRRRTRQKSLQHERIDREGREALPQESPDAGKCCAHGGEQAPKKSWGQAALDSQSYRSSIILYDFSLFVHDPEGLNWPA